MTVKEAAEIIKDKICAEQVAALYGTEPDRHGFAVCPFHGDRDASLKFYPGGRGWVCFGCHRGGTCIDYEMHAAGLTFIQAVRSLDAKFGLHLLDPAPVSLGDWGRAQAHEAEIRMFGERLQECWRLIARQYDTMIQLHWSRYTALSAIPKAEMTGAEWDELQTLRAWLDDLEDRERDAERRSKEKWNPTEPKTTHTAPEQNAQSQATSRPSARS